MKGYWISPDNKIYEIEEHALFISKNPDLFGLTEEEVKGIAFRKENTKAVEVILKVLKKGWIRVREYKQYTTFEFFNNRSERLKRIKEFCKKKKYWEIDRIKLSDLSKNVCELFLLKDLI